MPMDDDSWTHQVQRKTSLPIDSAAQEELRPRGKSAPNAAATGGDGPSTRRRGFSLARHQSVPSMSVGKTRRRRKVTFKNMYAPDVVPPPKVESYDELVFNVAGLFHTMSFLHDPEDWGDDPTSSMCSSEEDFYDPEPPLERSVPLMIAEFLYRSATYLGYPQGDTPWLPGFREDKRFSGNDVKRWRRLAHFDWEAEEKEFQKNHRHKLLAPAQPGLERTESVESNGHSSVMSTIGASFRMRRQDSSVSVDSVDSISSMRSLDNGHGSGKAKFRSTVSGWIRKHRRQHSRDNIVAQQENEAENVEKNEEKKKRHGKHKPVSWLNPPPVSSSRDLTLLVDIINSCVYCGQFQFRKRDIVRLCNVKI